MALLGELSVVSTARTVSLATAFSGHGFGGQEPPEPCSDDFRPGRGRAVFRLNASSNLATVAASATVANRGVTTDRCSIYASMSEALH